LLLEEALLRSDTRNWCIISEGSPRSIVMGISGKKEELIDCDRATQDGIPLIKRFSGGGTVIVDENTLFITLICHKKVLDCAPYPEPILRWHETLYREVFDHSHFHLRENDFVIADRKCGGNAQYIKKDRWLQHTSFLWDYSLDNMSYLLLPKKIPNYRQKREHGAFLCRLSDYFTSKAALITQLKVTLAKRFTLKTHLLSDVLSSLKTPERTATVTF
jgi:lipoate-protein ligase A